MVATHAEAVRGLNTFEIVKSAEGEVDLAVTPDAAVCQDCLEELFVFTLSFRWWWKTGAGIRQASPLAAVLGPTLCQVCARFRSILKWLGAEAGSKLRQIPKVLN